MVNRINAFPFYQHTKYLNIRKSINKHKWVNTHPRNRYNWWGYKNICQLNWKEKSGRRDSNPRRQPWEGCILPLNYFRICLYFITKKNLYKLLIYLLIKNTYIFNKRETRLVLDLLHAHEYSPLSLRLSRLVLFAIRFVRFAHAIRSQIRRTAQLASSCHYLCP